MEYTGSAVGGATAVNIETMLFREFAVTLTASDLRRVEHTVVENDISMESLTRALTYMHGILIRHSTYPQRGYLEDTLRDLIRYVNLPSLTEIACLAQEHDIPSGLFMEMLSPRVPLDLYGSIALVRLREACERALT